MDLDGGRAHKTNPTDRHYKTYFYLVTRQEKLKKCQVKMITHQDSVEVYPGQLIQMPSHLCFLLPYIAVSYNKFVFLSRLKNALTTCPPLSSLARTTWETSPSRWRLFWFCPDSIFDSYIKQPYDTSQNFWRVFTDNKFLQNFSMHIDTDCTLTSRIALNVCAEAVVWYIGRAPGADLHFLLFFWQSSPRTGRHTTHTLSHLPPSLPFPETLSLIC